MIDARLRTWERALVFGGAALALAGMFVRGQRIDIDRQVTSRLRYHAIPVAVSVLYYGRPYDYTAYNTIALGLQIEGTVESRIARALESKPPPNDKTYYWAADDRGMADYVIGAFLLFGPHVDSLYKFYFVVLGLSVLLFLIDLGWDAASSAMLLFALAALYACLSVIPLGNLTVPLFEPGSLFEPRIIELLSFVAALHLGITSFADSPWNPARIGIVGAQAAILALCYHARSSVAWEVLFVAIVAGTAWASRRWRPRGQPVPLSWPLVCVAATFVVMVIYERRAYNPRYFQDMGARTVWHNSLMGLGANRALAQDYKLGIGDAVVVDGVIAYLRDRRDPRLTADWTRTNILDSLGGYFVFNWFVYERAARDFYFHIWRVRTGDMLHLYLIDKPREIGVVIAKAIDRDPAPWRSEKGLYFDPFTAVALLVSLPGFVIVCTRRPSLGPVLAATSVLLACSLIPALLFYPVVHTMTGVFATLAVVCYLILAAILAAACRMALSRAGSDERPAV